MPLTNWLEDCVISAATGKTKFALTDTKISDPIITLFTQANAKLLDWLR